MFEPNSPQEPQWFPRPITDSIESSLDLLERLEEDRKRRLRNIATVAARTPIGLGSIEDRGHAGSASTHSTKPASCPGGANEYARYRHYPPLSLSAGALSHTSYHRNDLLAMNSSPMLVTTSVASRTNRQYRRGTAPRSTGGSSIATTAAATIRVDGGSARTLEADVSISDRCNMNVDDTPETSLHNCQRQLSSSSVMFASPSIDPRAGGGYSAGGSRRSTHAPHHFQLQSSGDRSGISTSYDVNSGTMPMAREDEWITPPALTVESQPPGHRSGEDIFNRRRDGSQRRRRRGWEELNI
jgi:hypothetical protein